MKKKRNIYLKMKTLDEAREILFNNFPKEKLQKKEIIDTTQSVGRVLSDAVFSKLSSPNNHCAAMDGIAVLAEETYNAHESNPKKLIIGKEAFFVNTGNILPKNTNSVIMIENVQIIDEDTVEIEAPAFPWQYVRKMGEDIVATEMLFPQNHEITPYCIGALITGGVFKVSVWEKPKILIIPTGSELVDWQEVNIENIKPGQVIESNSLVLGNLVEHHGGVFVRNNRLVDDPQAIKKVVQNAVDQDFDMVMINGGSSAGSEDYSLDVIKELGQVLIHGVTMMPGKPIVFGIVNEKPVFGMPGYPVSSYVAFDQFVKPLIYKILNKQEVYRESILVQPGRKIPSKLGIEEFLRVKLGMVKEKIIASPLPRGAGTISSITRADGIIRIPNETEGIQVNEIVSAELLKPFSNISNTIVVVGSHDNTLDILADQLRKENNNLHLVSSHVGSLGGIMAIKRSACHIAGTHLLNPEDGTYNVNDIKKYLPDLKLKLVNLVMREQGLIVAPGNPKKIQGIEDLIREDISFINRQAGSGTRVLLDYKLQEKNIDPAKIKGYESDEFTHMSVAVCVLSGSVDVGPGILSAAKALNLDFIPMVTEQYDLIIPEEFFETKNIQYLLKTIKTDEFKQRVEALGGYSTSKTGQIVWP